MAIRLGLLSSLLLPSLIFTPLTGALAAEGIPVTGTQVNYQYGQTLNFTANLNNAGTIDELSLFIKPEGPTDTQVISASINEQGKISASYDLREHPLRVFSEITYWFRVKFPNGEIRESQRFTFFYQDNRFAWESIQEDPLRVHWYSGDISFGQEVLNTARAGLQRVQNFLPLSPPSEIDIYVYNSPQDLQSTLNLSNQTWVAGHADPELDLIMVSLAPGPEQQLEMDRQIPHELMHVMLYESTPNRYDNLPTWFVEGLASLSELYPNPDYLVLLENANQKNNLIPVVALCDNFPRDASGALLAYAEAASFTRFVNNQFGTPGIEDLRKQYAAGLDCQNGAQEALGETLNRLEFQWQRETFTNQALPNLVREYGGWVVLIAAAIVAPLALIVKGLWGQPFEIK